MNDLWSKYAQQFYGERTHLKKDEVRYRKFTRAYKKIVGILDVHPQCAFLDMGCGCGEMAQAVKKEVGSYYGVDISFDSLVVAKKRNPHGLFILADMTTFYTNKRFDITTMVSSLEFCQDKHAALTRINEALKPSGQLYIEVRNSDFLFYKLFNPFIKLFQKIGLVSSYNAEGFKDLSVNEWANLLNRSGFKIIGRHQSIRPTIYGSLLTRIKNVLIRLNSVIAPQRYHFLVGFLCVKA